MSLTYSETNLKYHYLWWEHEPKWTRSIQLDQSIANAHVVLLLLLSRFSHVQLCATLWTTAHQALLSIGFSRQEYWSGLSCPFRESSWPRDWTPFSYVSCIGRLVLYHWATKKALILSNIISKKKKKKKKKDTS